MRAGVHQYVAEAIAFANYPIDDQQVMRMFAPRLVGQPTWSPTAMFLKAPDKQGLRDLMILLFGKDPNEYMSSPIDQGYGISPAADSPVAPAAAPSASSPHSEMAPAQNEEALQAWGFLRFGGDRVPVADLTINDDLPADLAWCFFALAPVIDALSGTSWVDQMVAADDLARAALRIERGLVPFNELHYEDMEALQDQAVTIEISHGQDGNYFVDVESFLDDRPTGLIARVALYLAYMQIETRHMERTLVYSAARLVDEVEARTGSLHSYDRELAAQLVARGHKTNVERNADG